MAIYGRALRLQRQHEEWHRKHPETPEQHATRVREDRIERAKDMREVIADAVTQSSMTQAQADKFLAVIAKSEEAF